MEDSSSKKGKEKSADWRRKMKREDLKQQCRVVGMCVKGKPLRKGKR